MKLLIYFICFLVLLNCKSQQDCMSPPPQINFAIIKNGVNISKDFQKSLVVYYMDNNIRKVADLQFSDNADAKLSFFYSYFPSLNIVTDRDYFIDLGDNSKVNLVKVKLQSLNSECNAYSVKSVSFNSMDSVLETNNLPPVYQFILK